MTKWRFGATTSTLGLIAAMGLALAAPTTASAQTRHHARHASVSQPGVHYASRGYGADLQEGRSALVSDGPGTGFGFHRLPPPFRIGAAISRDRQVQAVHEAVVNDAIDNADLRHGYPGSSVYQYGNSASYGVFTGGDSYGTPYFAGYYGPGDGADYGVFGHAYTN